MASQPHAPAAATINNSSPLAAPVPVTTTTATTPFALATAAGNPGPCSTDSGFEPYVLDACNEPVGLPLTLHSSLSLEDDLLLQGLMWGNTVGNNNTAADANNEPPAVTAMPPSAQCGSSGVPTGPPATCPAATVNNGGVPVPPAPTHAIASTVTVAAKVLAATAVVAVPLPPPSSSLRGAVERGNGARVLAAQRAPKRPRAAVCCPHPPAPAVVAVPLLGPVPVAPVASLSGNPAPVAAGVAAAEEAAGRCTSCKKHAAVTAPGARRKARAGAAAGGAAGGRLKRQFCELCEKLGVVEGLDYVRCNTCAKHMLRSSFAHHATQKQAPKVGAKRGQGPPPALACSGFTPLAEHQGRRCSKCQLCMPVSAFGRAATARSPGPCWWCAEGKAAWQAAVAAGRLPPAAPAAAAAAAAAMAEAVAAEAAAATAMEASLFDDEFDGMVEDVEEEGFVVLPRTVVAATPRATTSTPAPTTGPSAAATATTAPTTAPAPAAPAATTTFATAATAPTAKACAAAAAPMITCAEVAAKVAAMDAPITLQFLEHLDAHGECLDFCTDTLGCCGVDEQMGCADAGAQQAAGTNAQKVAAALGVGAGVCPEHAAHADAGACDHMGSPAGCCLSGLWESEDESGMDVGWDSGGAWDGGGWDPGIGIGSPGFGVDAALAGQNLAPDLATEHLTSCASESLSLNAEGLGGLGVCHMRGSQDEEVTSSPQTQKADY